MDRRRFLSGAATLATPVVAGCTGNGGGGDGGSSGGGGATAAGSGADATVEMRNTAFDPLRVDIDAGGTVQWMNEDSVRHDVTSAQFSDESAGWEFESTLAGGEATTHTFDAEGAYEYYCTIHGESTMCGVVLVGGVSYGGSLPCGSGGGGGY